MRATSLAVTLFASISMTFAVALGTSRTFLTPAFRSRGYGSSTSDEVSTKIVIAKDGYIYIAGTTVSRDAKEEAWGETDPHEQTGGKDVFVAKLSPSGPLKWVKRFGSTRDEQLNDLKLYKNALYLCGSTYGDLGRAVNGTSDAFIMKFSTNGEKLWKHPFQFGSSEGDHCNGLDVDENTGSMYVVGSTEGDLFKSPLRPSKGTHAYIVRLAEPKSAKTDVEIIKGHQPLFANSSSIDAVVVTKVHLMCMATAWSSIEESNKRLVTYLSRFDRKTLHLHRLDAIRPRDRDNFHGLAMDAVAETGETFVIGTTKYGEGKEGYYALAYSSTAGGGLGGVLWETFLGLVSPHLKAKYHSPSIVVDSGRGTVYVAGTEEGVSYGDSTEPAGIMVLPFFEINMTNGVIAQKWQRATPLSTNRQELTDLAHNERGGVVFTGLWNEGPNETTQALVGSYGSVASRADGARVRNNTSIVSNHDDEGETSYIHNGPRIFLVTGLGLSALFLFAMVFAKCRARRARTFHRIEVNELMDDDIDVQKRTAARAYEATSARSGEVQEVVVDQGTNKE